MVWLDAVTPVTQAVSDSSLPLTIGSGYAGGYVGGIDEVAVYSRALSAGEVLEHFEAVGDQAAYGLLVAGDGPVSYWRLDEAAGPVAVDEMAANYGTFKGTPVYGQPGAVAPPPAPVGLSVGFDGDDSVWCG